jgi:acylphosphatase
MKQKIRITGPQVHEVGYRYFLMSNALDLGLKGFNARNRTENGAQEIIALIEGDEELIEDFKKLVETEKPEQAKTSTIAFENYEGEVMRASEYAQVCSAMQLNKAIPLLLDMNGKMGGLLDINDKMNGVLDKMSGKMDGLLGKMDDVLDKQDKSIEEIRGLRVDIIKHSDERLMRIEKDIRAIKSKIGLR